MKKAIVALFITFARDGGVITINTAVFSTHKRAEDYINKNVLDEFKLDQIEKLKNDDGLVNQIDVNDDAYPISPAYEVTLEEKTVDQVEDGERTE